MFARWFILIAFACLLAWPDAARADKKWRTKENCTLIENESNDGDSFHIRVAKRHYIFRLLWVDTPETEQRYPERVAEQAAYFGITPEQACVTACRAGATRMCSATDATCGQVGRWL